MRPLNNRLNEENINKQGLKMKIIKYNGCFDIDVKFEKDGTIVKNRSYQEFKNGRIFNRNFPIKETKRNEMLNKENINKDGEKMKIIGYRSIKDGDLLFDDGTILYNIPLKHFKDGSIKNPNRKSVYGKGYIGIGKYNSNHVSYKTWHNMIERCYDEKCKKEHATYINCIACDEWLNFQNFAEWYNNNKWSNDCTVLDKDILVKGNKIYSPDTCVLVDNRLNSLFIKCNSARGKYPIGVTYHKRDKEFRARISYIEKTNEETFYKGKSVSFDNEIDAFYCYKDMKEKYIKQVADEYKNKYENFPKKLYEAMYNYKVEIND